MHGQSSSSHAPLASLAAHWHACKGDVPPPLVGASVTLVDDGSSRAKIYLFGGRLVTTRRMVNDMYILDLLTLEWTRHSSGQDGSGSSPQPRYFHSCDFWKGKLIIFGGMGYVQGNESELCVLNEVVSFDPETGEWDLQFSPDSIQVEGQIPEPRYAHLSSVTAHSLVIVGGQDMANHYVESINVFDLQRRQWVISQQFPKQRGSYRSLAVGPTWIVDEQVSGPRQNRADSIASSSSQRNGQPQSSALSASNINLLPTSKKSWNKKGKERRLPIYVYTNYNFTDVKREMEVIDFGDNERGRQVGKEMDDNEGSGGEGEGEDGDDEDNDISVEDQTGSMNGASLPPGLRFPMGAMLGSHLLISGTYLANTSQTFAVWALHLAKMTWSRLDVGPLLSTGSWNRGVLWPLQNRLLVFGHRDRDLVSDYNHRQTNWDHMLILELEAWGISQPPVSTASHASIEFGLEKLASSVLGSLSHSLPMQGPGSGDAEESSSSRLALGGRGDFEIVCSDGMKIGCDRVILEKRWPWFAEAMQDYRNRTRSLARRMYSDGTDGSLSPDLAALLQVEEAAGVEEPVSLSVSNAANTLAKADPRITPRRLLIGEPSPVVLALLIFFYTRTICTSIQRHPSVVAALLIVSKVYRLSDLEVWAKHAAHFTLANDLAPPISEVETPTTTTSPSATLHFSISPVERHRLAVALYEAATICGFEALQIRALRTVMSIAKWVQRSSLQSNKSSTSNTADSTVDGLGLQTSTTSTLFPDGLSSHPQDLPLRSSSTTMTSPNSLNRQSMGKAPLARLSIEPEGSSAVNVVRRPSKAERMLGMSGADIVASTNPPTKAEKMLGISSTETSGSVRSLGNANRAVSHPVNPNPGYQPPALLSSNFRRPSAPVSASSTTSSAVVGNRTSSTSSEMPGLSAGSSGGGRKRFSIFGRTSEVPRGTGGQEVQGVEAPAEEMGGTNLESRSIHRTNTNGTTGTTDDGTRSDSTTSASLPPPAFSEKEMKRMEKEGTRGRMTTLTRLKASALKSIDTSLSNSHSTTNGSNNLANPVNKATATPASLQSSLHSNQAGKLNDRELKALYSIWS